MKKTLNTWNCWLLINMETGQVHAAFKWGTEAENYANDFNRLMLTPIPFKIEVVPGLEYSDENA